MTDKLAMSFDDLSASNEAQLLMLSTVTGYTFLVCVQVSL